jgi:hypothetical protein
MSFISALGVMAWGKCAINIDSIEYAIDHETMGQTYV